VKPPTQFVEGMNGNWCADCILLKIKMFRFLKRTKFSGFSDLDMGLLRCGEIVARRREQGRKTSDGAETQSARRFAEMRLEETGARFLV
jgi:hypothetical protein